jgi:hypothetical protein
MNVCVHDLRSVLKVKMFGAKKVKHVFLAFMSRLGMYFLPHTIHTCKHYFSACMHRRKPATLTAPESCHTLTHAGHLLAALTLRHTHTHTHSDFPFQLSLTHDSFPLFIRRQCMDDKQSWLASGACHMFNGQYTFFSWGYAVTRLTHWATRLQV